MRKKIFTRDIQMLQKQLAMQKKQFYMNLAIGLLTLCAVLIGPFIGAYTAKKYESISNLRISRENAVTQALPSYKDYIEGHYYPQINYSFMNFRNLYFDNSKKSREIVDIIDILYNANETKISNMPKHIETKLYHNGKYYDINFDDLLLYQLFHRMANINHMNIEQFIITPLIDKYNIE